MPNYYTPAVDTWHALVAEMDDSDQPDASHFNPPTENLADNAAYIHKRFVNGLDGGTYAPTAPVIWQGMSAMLFDVGSGVDCKGTLTIDGSSTNHGALNIIGTGATCAVNQAQMTFSNAAVLTFQTGTGFLAQAGSTSTMGGELDVSGSIYLSGVAHVEIGANLYVDSGGTIVVSSGGTLNLLRGRDLVLSDATFPRFAAPVAMTIVQPFVFVYPSGAPAAGSSFDVLVDGTADFFVTCTRVRNGGQVTAINVWVTWTAHSAPPSLAAIFFYKTDVTSGTRTTIASQTINTTSGFGSIISLAVPGTEILDSTRFLYTIELRGENGTGSQSLTWHPPTMSVVIPDVGGGL